MAQDLIVVQEMQMTDRWRYAVSALSRYSSKETVAYLHRYFCSHA